MKKPSIINLLCRILYKEFADSDFGAYCEIRSDSSTAFSWAIRYIISSAKTTLPRMLWHRVDIIIKSIEKKKEIYQTVGWVYSHRQHPRIYEADSYLSLNEFKTKAYPGIRKKGDKLQEGKDPEPLAVFK